MIKKILKKCLPSPILELLRTVCFYKRLLPAFLHDCSQYIKYSGSKGYTDAVKMTGRIILEYHSIEKGLTMPELRLGFGADNLLSLINHCEQYVAEYGKDNIQLLHAIGVILEYHDLHIKNGYELCPEILAAIERVRQAFPDAPMASQSRMTRQDYFKHIKNDFYLFSNSRSSVRSFSTTKEVSLKTILEALELAKNTPSACNRQAWRSYVLTDKDEIKEILDFQGGNRGFGHLANKLIIITAELGVFSGVAERNQAFVDGGMYLMNVLYALHYYQIAACPLNCCVDQIKEKKYRQICHTKSSEVYISMIACGVPPEDFEIPVSKRSELDATNTVIDH